MTETSLTMDFEGIRQRLLQIMNSFGMNVKTFAEKTGIPNATMSQCLQGRNNPSLLIIHAVHHSFPDFGIEWILYGKETETLLTPSLIQEKEGGSLFSSHTCEDSSTPDSVQLSKALIADLQQGVLQGVRDVLQENQTLTREISEIRVYYTDGSYQVFRGGN